MSDVMRVPESFYAVSPGVHNACVDRLAALTAERDRLAAEVEALCRFIELQNARNESEERVSRDDLTADLNEQWSVIGPIVAARRERG